MPHGASPSRSNNQDFFVTFNGVKTWILQLSGALRSVYLPQGILDIFNSSDNPDTPPANRLRLYSKINLPFMRDSAGAVKSIGAAVPTAGTVLSADGTSFTPVTPGTPGQILTADPGEVNKVSWQPPGQPADVTGQFQASSPFIYWGTTSPISSQIQYSRVFIPQGVVLSSMKVFHILGGSPARNINLGIYDQVDPSDEAGDPNDKLAETGTTSTNVATNTFITAAFSGGNLTVPATGFYWLAFIADTGVPLQFASTAGGYPPDFVPVRAETSAGTTLPATASSLSNPGGALIFNAALEA